MENEYYVYVYLDPRKPGEFTYGEFKFDHEPFYIGKGKGLRIYSHLKDKSKNYKTNKIKTILKEKLYPIILKLKENLINKEACVLEIELIKIIGRINLKEGPLTNIMKGGNGGIINKKHAEALHKGSSKYQKKKWKKKKYRDKITLILRNNMKQNHKLGKMKYDNFKNKKHTKESKEKIGKANSIKGKGNNNSQFGTCWIYNEELKQNKKIYRRDEIPEGWKLGRKIFS